MRAIRSMTGIGFVPDLDPCNAGRAVARSDEELIPPAIALEGQRGAVRLFAVGLDGEALFLPQQVNLEAVPVDAKLHVGTRGGQPFLDEERE